MSNTEQVIQYNVVFTYGTYASSPEEALKLAASVIAQGNGAYVEVFQDGVKDAVVEGEVAGFNLEQDEPTAAESSFAPR